MSSIGRVALDLSKKVYEDGRAVPVPQGFEKIATFDRSYHSGYYGEAWSNGITVIIASRGSENYLNDRTDNLNMAVGALGNQMLDANIFIDDLRNQGLLDNKEVYAVGHSMGGSISQYMAAAQGFNAITFNAYGTREILKDQHIDFSAAENRITNYVVETDFTGNAAPQVGSTYYADACEIYGTVFG